jgi:hypothetical protein
MPTMMVRVKANMRGEYGVAGSIADPKHKTGVDGYTHVIRNAGEVFPMDMRAMKSVGALGTDDCERVGFKIDGKVEERVLPSWVESVKKKDIEPDALVPTGHVTRHDKNNVI